ncbi:MULTISPECIES: hypothetical protein [unclassified Lonepinella]|uniref:hypothetical protein n=1 Tax=unclassified Lonepinella TaxID=2642006 RepID=UPI0036DCB48B
MISKQFIQGFAFNRKHFHTTTNACISCILWGNVNSNINQFELDCYDIDKKDSLLYEDKLTVKQVKSLISSYYDQREFNDDELNGISVELNGTECLDEKKARVIKRYNKNIVGYVVANGQGFDNPRLNSALTITGRYDANGEFLRSDNFLEILPIFSTGKYTDHVNHWKIMSMLMKSADKKIQYQTDCKNGKLQSFLLKNLFWVTLTHYTKLRSLNGSDGRFYRNELSLDTTNGETLASEILKKLNYSETEEKLITQWKSVLKEAKKNSRL